MEIASPYRQGAIVAGRYELEERLGRGGMGEVWRARHVTLLTEVALKFPAINGRGRAARVAMERFRFEAQVAARLGQETAHVVAVHDAGTDAAGPFLVMEYVRGRTLQEELDARGALSLGEVAQIVAQVAEALDAAHTRGVVHRDLKPSNLLLADRAGELHVKVADFGIAKALSTDLGADLPADTTGGMMLGSPPYMSPEQMGGARAAASGDLWALAVIAYEAITGDLPFSGRSFVDLFASLARGRFARPSERRPNVPAAVDEWFARALAKEPAKRFRDARAMAEAFALAAVRARARESWARRAALRLSLFAGRLSRSHAPGADPDRGPGSVERQASSRDLG
jgi:serine/threonine-protein kinase